MTLMITCHMARKVIDPLVRGLGEKVTGLAEKSLGWRKNHWVIGKNHWTGVG
jgi:hypothetical protein